VKGSPVKGLNRQLAGSLGTSPVWNTFPAHANLPLAIDLSRTDSYSELEDAQIEHLQADVAAEQERTTCALEALSDSFAQTQFEGLGQQEGFSVNAHHVAKLSQAATSWCASFTPVCQLARSNRGSVAESIGFVRVGMGILLRCEATHCRLGNIGNTSSKLLEPIIHDLRSKLSLLNPRLLPTDLQKQFTKLKIAFAPDGNQTAAFQMPCSDVPVNAQEATSGNDVSFSNPYAHMLDSKLVRDREDAIQPLDRELLDTDNSVQLGQPVPPPLAPPSTTAYNKFTISGEFDGADLLEHLHSGSDASARPEIEGVDPFAVPPNIELRQQPSQTQNRVTELIKQSQSDPSSANSLTGEVTMGARRAGGVGGKVVIRPPPLRKEDIEKVNLDEVYGGSKGAEADRGAGFVGKIKRMEVKAPKEKIERWTYQRLVDCKPLSRMVGHVLKEYQDVFPKLAVGDIRHTFEWLLVLDNSGSMVLHANPMFQAMAVMIEVLRRIECKFAVVMFGAKGKELILKDFKDPFSNLLGQQMIERFTFDQGTYPATALSGIVPRMWPSHDQEPNVHRAVITITDGLTTETRAEDFTPLLRIAALKFLHLQTPNVNVGSHEMIERLRSHPPYLDVRTVHDSKTLSAEIVNLLIKHFEREVDVIARAPAQPIAAAAATVVDAEGARAASELVCAVEMPTQNSIVQLCRSASEMLRSLTLELSGSEAGLDGATDSLWRVNDDTSAKVLETVSGEPRHLADQAKREDALAKALSQLQDTRKVLEGLGGDEVAAIESVLVSWMQLETRADVLTVSDSLSLVFEEALFPNNRHTRRRADVHGSTLYLPGLIKAVITDWTYKKYLSTKTAGGRRDYGVVIALDVSQSMSGHLSVCALLTLVAFISSLFRVGIETFSVLVFGEKVKLIKTFDTAWDAATIFLLLSAIDSVIQYASFDGEAVDYALDLFRKSGIRGPKRVFVLTDGYSSVRKQLLSALKRADEQCVEVIAVGVGCDNLYIDKSYRYWVRVLEPSCLADALRAFADHSGSGQLNLGSQPTFISAGQESFPEDRGPPMFDMQKEIEEMRGEIDATIAPSSFPGKIVCDVCVCLDVSGSMAPFLNGIKQDLFDIIVQIKPLILQKQQGLDFLVRFAVIPFRDDGLSPLDFLSTEPENLEQHRQRIFGQVAQGGDDIAEDVAEAIDCAVGLTWEKGPRFLLLLTDAPGHGTLNPNPAQYSDTRPSTVNAEAVIRAVARNKTDLFFGQIRDSATHHMQERFQTWFNDEGGKFGRSMTVIPHLFGANPDENACFHFVFCLDESGSMSGSPWTALVAAYQSFLTIRRQSQRGSHDLVSVVQFSSSARIIFQAQPLGTCPNSLSFGNGGTSFNPALLHAQTIFARAPNAVRPVLVFMTDGQNSDGAATVSTIRTMKGQFSGNGGGSGLNCIGIRFGQCSSSGLDSMMAPGAGNGRVIQATTSADLMTAFEDIARGSSARDSLAQHMADSIARELVNKIVVDYL